MTLSYAIPVCNEWLELEYLLNYLFKHKRTQDEIVVQCDKGNTTPSVYQVLKQFSDYKKLKVVEFPLNKDFSSFKNNLKDACNGDYIFQIDADEYPDDYLMGTVEEVIKMNDNVDVFWVPRINKVNGLTQEHINKWRWNVELISPIINVVFLKMLNILNGKIRYMSNLQDINLNLNYRLMMNFV